MPPKGKKQPGITPIEFWEQGFSQQPWYNEIEKILEFPGTEDMAGVLARGNFRSDRQRIAAVRLAYKNRKFNDKDHQLMLRDAVASTMGEKALGKMLQTQIGTGMLMPTVLREILGMKRLGKNETERIEAGPKNSDFREREVISGNGHGEQ